MTHTCEHSQKLHSLKDSELNAGDERVMKQHLQSCEACRAQWEALTGLSRMMDGIDDVSPLPGFDRTFWDKVARYEEKRSIHWLRRLFNSPVRRIMIPVSAVLVVTAGLYLGIQTRHSFPTGMTLVEQIDLMEDFDVVDHLDLLENWDAINRMNVKS